MLPNIWILSALCAGALAAPTLSYSAKAVSKPADMKLLADYFKLLASKVQAGRNMADAPVCNLATATLPVLTTGTPLPKVGDGLVLKHVAIGRGTQNYTCGTNSTAAPAAIGAVATLYNASCLASAYPDLLLSLPAVALQFSNDVAATLTPSNLVISGHHYFTNLTTPFFDLTSATGSLGQAPSAKNASAPAPSDAAKGLGGEPAVPWLKLTTRDGATGGLKEVFRINTAGGSAPATCAGKEGTEFDVQYAAEYWFYGES